MSSTQFSYSTILQKAKNVVNNVKKDYTLGEATSWSYYFGQAILHPGKVIDRINFSAAKDSNGTYISRDIYMSTYKDMAKRLVNYVREKEQLPNNIKFTTKSNKTYYLEVKMYMLLFAKVLVYYDKNKEFPQPINITSKAFIKPTETTNGVYDLFVKTFGKISCIDDALEKIAGRGYGYYYDDHKSNAETITSIASGSHSDDPNCTDATQMMKNVADGTGKYKKVDCVHVKCRGGDGHVYLKITQKDGSVFYRDPAAVLDSGDITRVWCSDGTVLAINPSWWTANLYK